MFCISAAIGTIMCRESVAKKQEELRAYEVQINNATKGVDLDSSLETVQNKLQTNQEYVFVAVTCTMCHIIEVLLCLFSSLNVQFLICKYISTSIL